MVLFLGFAAAMAGMMLVVFNSGQVTNAKMRAINAADAAAYSGALWEARSLNFQAYMNRAMVVNEVTIAQSVSLRSWTAYLARFVTNVNTVARFIPYVGTATTAVKQVITVVDNGVQRVLPPFDILLRAVNLAEHSAQIGLYTPGSLIAQGLASDVAIRNGATVSTGGNALMLLNASKWLNLTKRYEGNDRTRIRTVTLDSRDGFTQARDKKWDDPTGVVFELRKQGGTDLLDYDSWKGLDSSQLRTVKIFGKWRGKASLGWGGAQSYSRNRIDIGRHGNINEWGDWDGRLAQGVANNAGAKNVRIPFQGYFDVRDTISHADLVLPFSVEVFVDKSRIPNASTALNAQTMLIDGTRLEQDPRYAADQGVYALAEACVRFVRPYGSDRADGAQELPSLFNPYWTASLATESKAARVAVDGFKRLPPPASTFFGKDTCI